MRRVTEQQAEEILRCKEDPVYFTTEYLWLKHTTKGKIRWNKPYPYQVKVLRALHNGDNVVVCKSRRVGATWVICAFALWYAMFHPDLAILFLSQKEFSAKGLLKRVKFMYNNLPKWMQQKVGVNTQTEMSFVFRSGGQVADSTIYSLTTTNRSGAGEDAALVLVDEAAFVEHAEEVWSAIGPTAAFGGQRVVVSTMNSTEDFFYRIVSGLKLGQIDGFTYIEAHWKRDCGLSDEWYKKATLGLSLQRRLREFEMVALTTGSPFFDLLKVDRCYKPLDKHPEIHKVAIKTPMHFIGVDTSEGRVQKHRQEPDYHSICVLNEFGVQIDAFHNNKMSLRDFAGHVTSVGESRVEVEGIPTKYHREYPGVCVIESWGSGDVTVSRHQVPRDRISELRTWRQTNTSKMRALNSLRQAINDEQIVITDPFTHQCLKTFEDQTTGVVEKAGAAPGTYDDPVISLALAWSALKRHGGFQYDFRNAETVDGRRMIAVHSKDDLDPSEIGQVLSVGERAIGPIVDLNKKPFESPGSQRMSDDLERYRRGRARMRPPGM